MLLLIGGESELGAATFAALRAQAVPVAATTRRRERVDTERPFLDLSAPLAGWEPPAGTTAACIFAATARLAACAADPVGSAHINVRQTLALAERLIERNISLLFLSSNQVFDGRVPNVPADAPPSPISEYGRQKALVEAALRRRMDAGARVAILRLGRVVSPTIPLLRDWIAALCAGRAIHAFHDMTIAPSPIDTVAGAISALLCDRAWGIFQLTGPRDASYVEVGRFLASRLGADPVLVKVTSASDAGMPAGAARPHTTLDSSAMRDRYGCSVPDVWAVIERVAAK
jgi:dTDP-4-dehydrorhamnose reductase